MAQLILREQQERGWSECTHLEKRADLTEWGNTLELSHPSSPAGGREMEQGGNGRLGIAEYLAPEICAGSINLHFMVLSWDSYYYLVGKLIQAEFLGRLRFRPLVESKDPYLAALEQKLISVCLATGSGSGDRHNSWEAGNSSFHPPGTSTTPVWYPTLLQGLSSSRIELLDTRGCHIQIWNAKETWSRVKLLIQLPRKT